ncbi:MAG: hypothetical protein BWY85_00690 [Firmicutes bacterium ADurb.Bin506]|nr:MAG: hypothetical protein BWY85_00690 [Firmicutes bacterium ADurb.Bin506]
MSPAVPDGAGGAYELSASWSGPVYSGGQNGVNASLAVGAGAGGDNLDGSSDASQRSMSSDVSLTVRAREWIVRAKYGVNSKKGLAGESPTLGTVKRTASLEAAAPFRLGDQQVSADALLSRTTTHNVIDDGLRVSNAVLLRASTAVGSTSVGLKAGLSADSADDGALSRQIDVGLSLSRPIKLGKMTGLTCGADLGGVDKQKGDTATRSAEALAWLTYAPTGRVSVTLRAKGQLTYAGTDYDSVSRGGWLEAEARVLF